MRWASQQEPPQPKTYISIQTLKKKKASPPFSFFLYDNGGGNLSRHP
jgi:hypothetical protein